MARTWETDDGKVLVIEDADTASLVIVGKDLRDRAAKAKALEDVLRKLSS